MIHYLNLTHLALWLIDIHLFRDTATIRCQICLTRAEVTNEILSNFLGPGSAVLKVFQNVEHAVRLIGDSSLDISTTKRNYDGGKHLLSGLLM